jgi:hypothetical protein
MAFEPPNQKLTGSHIGHSSSPLDGSLGPRVMPPNMRFRVGEAKMPQPPSAVEPGQGAIPVEPFGKSGEPKSSTILPDSTMRRPRR